MLETEVSKTGEVTVEGHVIGRLQGFEFALDASGAGQDAKALRAAAAKVLATEIEARAAKLAAAPDDQIVLSNDGVIRWIGEPVARLVAGEAVLEPRFRVLADEQLNGPARESVDARLTMWLKAHVEKLLGPLNALAKAEDITGIARGIAFQVVEALGVLERTKVAEEVKGLDQETRATLRKYGVRFGAYHIYLPALLKPAPRTFALLLWALQNGGLEQKGVDELPGLASSGRTSIAIDPEISKNLYRLVGYRVCGNRAIRVDILERLADLIRPALSWRPAMPGEKPAGAFDGRGFTVTVAMTSLAGCSGEDFASILKSLGYRLDRRPPLPAAAPAQAAPVEAAEAPATETGSESVPEAPAETPEIDAPSTEPVELGLGGADAQTSEPIVSDAVAAEPPAAETAEKPADEAKPADPALVDVWRPGRPEGARRPQRREREKPRRRETPALQLPAQAAQQPGDGAAAAEAKPQEPREKREHRNRPPRGKGGKDRPRGPRPDRPQVHQSRPERPRDKPIDPNSPFAALLELKARLEADQKQKD